MRLPKIKGSKGNKGSKEYPEEELMELLPHNISGKTFAEASKEIGKESKERELDRISRLGRDTMLGRLAMTQETMREDPNNLFVEGGALFKMDKIINSPVGKAFIKGGKAHKELKDNKEINVDPTQLAAGIHVEMEHTKNPKVAREIALDHLVEKPDYYTRLYGSGIADEKIPQSLMQALGIRGEESEARDEGLEMRKGGKLKGNKCATGGNLFYDGKPLSYRDPIPNYMGTSQWVLP